MKRTILIVMVLSTMLLLGGCESEPREYMPTGMWYLMDDYGEALPMTLTFNGETVAVQYAVDDWPTDNGVWEYYINQENEMCITQYCYDADNDYTTETLTLDWAMLNGGSLMALSYKPLWSSTRHFNFGRVGS